jgi:hypothetical protein
MTENGHRRGRFDVMAALSVGSFSSFARYGRRDPML